MDERRIIDSGCFTLEMNGESILVHTETSIETTTVTYESYPSYPKERVYVSKAEMEKRRRITRIKFLSKILMAYMDYFNSTNLQAEFNEWHKMQASC